MDSCFFSAVFPAVVPFTLADTTFRQSQQQQQPRMPKNWSRKKQRKRKKPKPKPSELEDFFLCCFFWFQSLIHARMILPSCFFLFRFLFHWNKSDEWTEQNWDECAMSMLLLMTPTQSHKVPDTTTTIATTWWEFFVEFVIVVVLMGVNILLA